MPTDNCGKLLRMPAFWDKYPPDPTLCDLSPTEKADIQKEVFRQVKEKLRAQAFCETLDKQAYMMEKSQLFRRLQNEKEERNLQECMCKAENDRCKRQRQIQQEENFAEAFRKLKEDEIRDSGFRKQLFTCDAEIRKLESQIRRAYYAKTLYAQRLEGEAFKLEDKMRQMEQHEIMMENIRRLEEEDRQKEIEEFAKKREYMKALKTQMEGDSSKQARKIEEFQKDKQMIDEIVESIKKEEIEDLIEKRDKVKLYQSEIKHFLDARELHQAREKARREEEEKKIKEFVAKKEADAVSLNKAKETRDAAKAQIVAKTIEKLMQDQFKSEELEELRRELYEEELAEEVRRKDAEDEEKRCRQMIELQQAEAEAKRLRAEKIAAERQEAEEYRKELMAKFAEDERLEQMSNEKRRQREREHRKKVEEMIIERRALKAGEKEREQAAMNCYNEETGRRVNVCDEERIRLLKLHGPKILGFIPRGVIRSREELERLGEPFISYYLNQRREPDPTTIDAEPCEEELFKNMTISSSNKY